MSAPTRPTTLLTHLDLCDSCVARARVLVILPSGGELLFCGHHARVYRELLPNDAVLVQDSLRE